MTVHKATQAQPKQRLVLFALICPSTTDRAYAYLARTPSSPSQLIFPAVLLNPMDLPFSEDCVIQLYADWSNGDMQNKYTRHPLLHIQYTVWYWFKLYWLELIGYTCTRARDVCGRSTTCWGLLVLVFNVLPQFLQGTEGVVRWSGWSCRRDARPGVSLSTPH